MPPCFERYHLRPPLAAQQEWGNATCMGASVSIGPAIPTRKANSVATNDYEALRSYIATSGFILVKMKT